jgi:CBS domain-containing protein
MLSGQILAAKGAKVVSTRPDATIADVAKLLRREKIGAVVVMEAEALRGIISERDLARGLADHGADLLEMKVGQLMTRDVVTCTPDAGIDHLMQTMTEGRFRHLPVLRDGKIAGIVSIGDVVKHRLDELEAETHQLQDYIAGTA